MAICMYLRDAVSPAESQSACSVLVKRLRCLWEAAALLALTMEGLGSRRDSGQWEGVAIQGLL